MTNSKRGKSYALKVIAGTTAVLITGLIMAILIGTADILLGYQEIAPSVWFSWTWFTIFVGGAFVTFIVAFVVRAVTK